MPSLASRVPFVSTSKLAAAPSPNVGFEAAGGLAAPAMAAPSPRQVARATDLFLRGALTSDQLAQAKTSRGGFERVVGKNNLLPAVFLETGAAISRATCLVRASGIDFEGNAGSWVGTGFMLSPNVMVTNHHVLNSTQTAAAASCVFDYQIGLDGRPKATRVFAVRPERLFITSPLSNADGTRGLDFTVVWVDGEPGAEFGHVRPDRKAFAIAEQEYANVISHPGGRMKMLAVQDNQVQWQDELVVHYTSDTEPGSSGASVCNNNWRLVALHHASQPSQVPEFHFLNEGIKLSAIAAFIEQLAGAGNTQAAEVMGLFGGTDEELGFFGGLGRTPPSSGSAIERVVKGYEGTDADIDMGFWNVEWFTRTYDTKTPAVAQVIRQLNLDVWALEEAGANAAEMLVRELKDAYGLDYGYLAAEPNAAAGKQSCVMVWNTKTVDCTREDWGEPIETWLRAGIRNFDGLGVETGHGRIFDRYPALFRVRAKSPAAFEAFVVPIRLKAKAEGSTRRRMASKILAAAVRKMIDAGASTDWVFGGDFNAPLATDDFAALVGGDMVPLGAQDEAGGAFSYVKGPRSLIDHIFLSPNLAARFGASDYFIVATEKDFPRFVREISGHRPVLARLSLVTPALGGAGVTPPTTAALDELNQILCRGWAKEPTGDGFERTRASEPAASYAEREGYVDTFLGDAATLVPLPALSDKQSTDAAVVDPRAAGVGRFVLRYTHFSVVMNGRRRLPFYTATNIDGTDLRRIPRESDAWAYDPRIRRDEQVGDELYAGTDLDRGHMTRRLDPVWGKRATADLADLDTFHFTNCCPQHRDLNRREWLRLEDYVLGHSETDGLKVSVFTGPIFGARDREFRAVRIPEAYWKVVVMRRKDTQRLSATAYVLGQKDMIGGLETFAFGAFKTYQVTVRDVERRTGLGFGSLRDADPMSRARPESSGGFESAAGAAKLIEGPGDVMI